ncbi:MAG: hypothetical protein Q9218_004231 [Villophora microphyllina]
MDVSRSEQQSPFLRLPYELRLQIYDLVFFNDNPDRIINAWRSESIDFWGPGVHISLPFDSRFTNLSLLQTCHVIHHEAKDFFYQSLTLQFTLDQGGERNPRDPIRRLGEEEDIQKVYRIPPESRKLVHKVEICILFVSHHTHGRLLREWQAVTNLIAEDFESMTSLKIEGPQKYTPWALRDCLEGMFTKEYSEQRLYVEPLLRVKRLQHLDIDHFDYRDTGLLLCGMSLEGFIGALTGSVQRVGAMRFRGL